MTAPSTNALPAGRMRVWFRDFREIAFSDPLKARTIIVLILFVAHIAATVLLVKPGHYSIDEGIYHQMVANFAESGTLEAWTGYDEFPSPELTFVFHKVRDGRLYPQYPYLTAIIAWPFYKMFGYHGMFLLNAVAYVGIAIFCFATARRVFGDTAVALDSVIILTVATFAWEYSQAAWPHAVAVLFVVAALHLTIRGLAEDDDRRMWRFALAAGAVIGVGAGVRLDVTFVTPAIVLPYFFLTPFRVRPALAAVAGALPGLAGLAITNYVKFGNLSPFSYGTSGQASEVLHYLPVVALGSLGVGLLWLSTRQQFLAFARRRPLPVLGAAVLAVGLALLVPSVGKNLAQLASGGLQILVDLRFRDAALLEGGMVRSASGAVIYGAGLKKTLLQSLPWLPLLFLPLAAMLRPHEPRRLLGVLFLSSTGYLTVYSYFAWHGGLALNMRYFLPFLPTFVILGAWALSTLAAETTDIVRRIAVFTFPVTLNIVLFLFRDDSRNPEALEGLLLTIPLVVAAILSILLLFRSVARTRLRAVMSGASLVVAAAAIGWASASALAYDYILDTSRRAGMAKMAAPVTSLVEPDSIVFVYHETPFFGLYDKYKVRVAAPYRDDFRSFRPLLEFHLQAERPVYLALGEDGLKTARQRGLLDGLSLIPLSDEVFRVYPPEGRAPADASHLLEPTSPRNPDT